VYTLYENVEFALLLLGQPAAERRRRVMAALDWVHLADRAKSRPGPASGGQSRGRDRSAIVKEPEIVLADEPTANLDAEELHNVLQTMERIIGTSARPPVRDPRLQGHAVPAAQGETLVEAGWARTSRSSPRGSAAGPRGESRDLSRGSPSGNLLGAGLRTWLNVFVLSLSFVLVIFSQGLLRE